MNPATALSFQLQASGYRIRPFVLPFMLWADIVIDDMNITRRRRLDPSCPPRIQAAYNAIMAGALP